MIPDEVAEALVIVTEYAKSWKLEPCELIWKWLDSQPTMPVPEWDKAPEWAQWWAVEASEIALWFEFEPALNPERFVWEASNGYNQTYGVCLPIGIDWRQTLRRRPEAE